MVSISSIGYEITCVRLRLNLSIDHISTVGETKASLIRICVATLFGLLVLSAWIGLPFNAPYVGYSLASAFLFQVAVRPRRREVTAVLVLGAALALLDRFIVNRGGGPQFQFSACFGFLGLASFTILGFRTLWADRDQRTELKSILLPAAAFTFFILGSTKLLNMAGMLFPHTTDLYAYAFDGSLGFQPSFAVGRLFRDYPWIGAAGHFTYYLLPLPMALTYAAHLRRKASPPLFMLEIFMTAGLLGYFFYLTFPAVGPLYVAGPEFPGSPLSLSDLRHLQLHTVPINWIISRNAMPSLHVAWALLIWFNCKPFSRTVRKLAFAFVMITLFDTLGTGEHYLIDLVAAFPFAVAVQAICAADIPLRSQRRLVPLFGGVALTLIWSLLLRYATHIFLLNPVVPWAGIIATTVLSSVWIKQILKSDQTLREESVPFTLTLAAGA